jgi:NCAIR mutase (PurE)-related protein
MDPTTLRALLESLERGALTVDEAVARLRDLPFEQLEDATVDHHRALRCGYPEVIFAERKTPGQVVGVARRIAARGQTVLATRADAEHATAVAAEFDTARYDPVGRTLVVPGTPAPALPGRLLVVSAGTADAPVAAEAVTVAEVLGCTVDRLQDVGVAGLHRLLAAADELKRATVIIVVAGMEGALPSVIGGLTDVPLIAVPTSVGYGASFGGVAALLGMLTSCASGVTVVNIDNGFGAAYAAARILRRLDAVAAPTRSVGE